MYCDLHFLHSRECREDMLRCLDKLPFGSDHQEIVKSVFVGQPFLIQEMLVDLIKPSNDYNVTLQDACLAYFKLNRSRLSEKSALYWVLFRHICKLDGSYGAQCLFANIAAETLRQVQQLLRCKSRSEFGSRDLYVQEVIFLFRDLGHVAALDVFLDSDELKVEFENDQEGHDKSFYSESLPVVEAWVDQQCRKAQKKSSHLKAMNELMAYLDRIGLTRKVAPASAIFRDFVDSKFQKLPDDSKFIEMMLLKLKGCAVKLKRNGDDHEQFPMEVFCRSSIPSFAFVHECHLFPQVLLVLP